MPPMLLLSTHSTRHSILSSMILALQQHSLEVCMLDILVLSHEVCERHRPVIAPHRDADALWTALIEQSEDDVSAIEIKPVVIKSREQNLAATPIQEGRDVAV
eukprot:gnl/TRDRNA2_/TRDRNA2_133726_c0_seq2.p2 gnl/TRDRNA2_/TRDRNA2_133726_c0~~gnl/TRDRNA2_/TRDRNA2_133726_c0_seq2.p2  ORF type:complete len:103 (-),score=19.77 gnl/TRDRNA2_/TRDRNA2_133726_c0_seq2:12-320(-)